jgi:hypothetical protein
MPQGIGVWRQQRLSSTERLISLTPKSFLRDYGLQATMAQGMPYRRRGRATRCSTGAKHPRSIVLYNHFGAYIMSWTKPEAEVVAVTMEVTAYVATL